MENQNNNSLRLSLVVITIDINEMVSTVIRTATKYLNEIDVFAEVIVVHSDNCNLNTDNFDKSVKVKMKNAAFSRNQALAYCEYGEVVFLDNDTIVNKEWAQEVKEFLQKDYLDALFFDSKNERSHFKSSVDQNGILFKADTAGSIFKKSIFDSGIVFDERFYRAEDCEIATKLAQKGYCLKFSSVSTVDNDKAKSIFKRQKLKLQNIYYMNLLFHKYMNLPLNTLNLKLYFYRIFFWFKYKNLSIERSRKYKYFKKVKEVLSPVNGIVFIIDNELMIKEYPEKLEKICPFKIYQKGSMRIIELS